MVSYQGEVSSWFTDGHCLAVSLPGSERERKQLRDGVGGHKEEAPWHVLLQGH